MTPAAYSTHFGVPITATIDTAKTGASISKNICGQFLERGDDIVNTGIWSEMLVDRKFLYPASSTTPMYPPVIGGAGGNPRFRPFLRSGEVSETGICRSTSLARTPHTKTYSRRYMQHELTERFGPFPLTHNLAPPCGDWLCPVKSRYPSWQSGRAPRILRIRPMRVKSEQRFTVRESRSRGSSASLDVPENSMPAKTLLPGAGRRKRR